MMLVSILVESGGDDLASNWPYAAFRKWCSVDPRRAIDVIISARAGDALALRHLVFALEASESVEEAFQSASAEGEERTAGVLALSRMSLDAGQAERALDVILSAAAALVARESAGLTEAALDIAGKHPELDRSGIAAALVRLSRSSDPIVVHLMATALYWHGKQMSDVEVASCLLGIEAVDTQNTGTVKQIDEALCELWPSRPRETGNAIASLITKTKKQVGHDALKGILLSQDRDGERIFAELATGWLLKGDHHVCNALSSHFSEVNSVTPRFQIPVEALPADPFEQIYVCRKAIGYFFHSPMMAASWVVAVLRKNGSETRDAGDLLFDPLLLNYDGALKDWLEGLLEEDAPGNDVIRQSLTRAREVWDGFAAAREVVELEPSSAQRALVWFQEAEEAERIHEAAREESIFADLFTTQMLLYGDRSSFSILDGEGVRRPQTSSLTAISFSTELPRCLFFDPVGLEFTLRVFRHERRADE